MIEPSEETKARQIALNAPLKVLNLIERCAEVADHCEAMDERDCQSIEIAIYTLREIRKLLPWARETLGAMIPGAGCDYGDEE